jgi:hypothetical protein
VWLHSSLIRDNLYGIVSAICNAESHIDTSADVRAKSLDGALEAAFPMADPSAEDIAAVCNCFLEPAINLKIWRTETTTAQQNKQLLN